MRCEESATKVSRRAGEGFGPEDQDSSIYRVCATSLWGVCGYATPRFALTSHHDAVSTAVHDALGVCCKCSILRPDYAIGLILDILRGDISEIHSDLSKLCNNWRMSGLPQVFFSTHRHGEKATAPCRERLTLRCGSPTRAVDVGCRLPGQRVAALSKQAVRLP